MRTIVASTLALLALAAHTPAADGSPVQGQNEQLFGGRAYLAFRDGSSAIGAIYGLMGEHPRLLVLTDGRRFSIADIEMIDFETVGRSYEVDIEGIEDWTAAFILRDGAVVPGVLVDYRSEDSGSYWLLQDGRRIPAQSVSRLHFR